VVPGRPPEVVRKKGKRVNREREGKAEGKKRGGGGGEMKRERVGE